MRSYFSLLGAVIIFLASACATDTATGIWITGNDAQAGFDRWEATAPPETREMIQRLKKDRTLVIHIREGVVRGKSRGASSSAGSPAAHKRNGCFNHPPSDELDPRRNWDLVYDKKQQAQLEKESKLLSPTHVLLHHEIMGHILPALNDPTLIDAQDQGDEKVKIQIENRATEKENDYRKLLNLPLIPPTRHAPRR